MKYLKSFEVFENIKFCTECGTELDLKSVFCAECGKKQDMLDRPKSDDEKSILNKINDVNVNLKDKIDLIISAYEKDIQQNNDFSKKALDVLSEYQKKYGFDDERYKKAFKLCKKSNIIDIIEIYKSKSQDPEYKKTLDSIIDEFHDKDVDNYDSFSIMMKGLLLDAARLSSERKGKPWQDQYMNLAKSFKRDSKNFTDNSTKIMSQIIALDMMVSVASKYPSHKIEFDKLFQDFLKNNKTSDFLEKVYNKEEEIKKQMNSPKIGFDSSGNEVKSNSNKIRFDSSGKEIK